MRNALMDTTQAASNNVAGMVSGPVDLITAGLRALGVPVPRNALMSSEWMEQKGFTRPVQQGAPRVIGETLGMVSPTAIAAKAPRIAAGVNQMMANAAAPRTLNPQSGVMLVAPNRANKEQLAKVMQEMQELGPPKIRAVWDGGAYVALEGSHRLLAAKKLGIDPEITEMHPRQWLTNHDLYDLPDKTSVARALRYLQNSNVLYDFPNIPKPY
jgi:hypothetical protein